MKSANQKFIVWSNENLDIEDWREAYIESLEINDCEVPEQIDDAVIYDFMYDTNNMYLDDERINLNRALTSKIIVIADLGLWNGRKCGYKEIGNNIRDCLYANGDYTTWYVDSLGDFRCDTTHHDGTNHYLYRVYKDNISETQIDNFKEKLYNGTVTRADITRLTRRLGDEIACVYGWKIRGGKK